MKFLEWLAMREILMPEPTPGTKYTSSGVLVSDPKAKSIPNPGKWWLIIQCEADIGRYYRSQFNFFNRAKDVKLQAPAWESHISVIRGEEPQHPELWGSWDGQQVEFSYDPQLQTNEEYFWLNVECPAALDIREKLGLSRTPQFNLHLTIGRIT
jgi:hypothetical protein